MAMYTLFLTFYNKQIPLSPNSTDCFLLKGLAVVPMFVAMEMVTSIDKY